MRFAVAAGVAITLASVPAFTAEIIAFKRDSRYQGGAMKVADVALDKHGVLLITSVDGELYSASPDDVDWELSKRLTEQEQERERARQQAAEAEAEAERRAIELAQRQEKLSVLQASRRYGIDQPAVTVAEGSAVSQSAAAPVGVGQSISTTSGESPVGKALAAVTAAKAEREALAQELEQLRADRNPDPLWASIRENRIKTKSDELAQLDRRIGGLEAALEQARRAVAEQAAKARKAAEAAEKKRAQANQTPTP